jgi:hypothetical protein
MQSSKNLLHNTPSPKSLSNAALLRNTQSLVAEERKLTTAILWHLHEIQVRRLYAEKGFGSLFEYAVQALGYSHAAAGRRIAAMRLLVDLPEIEPALQKGSLSLSILSTIQSFIQRKEEPISRSEKKELVLALQGKSRRECEKHLIALDPIAATPQESERVVSPTQTEIRFVADDELIQKLKKIQSLDGHVQSNSSYLNLFHRLADLALKKLDPMAQKKVTQRKSEITSTPPAELKTKPAPAEALKGTGLDHLKKTNPRYIPAALKREIWKRHQAQCSYQSADGKRCSSRYALEIDHIQPLALGGKSEASNLRLLCRKHNQQQAFLKLGAQTMLPFCQH